MDKLDAIQSEVLLAEFSQVTKHSRREENEKNKNENNHRIFSGCVDAHPSGNEPSKGSQGC